MVPLTAMVLQPLITSPVSLMESKRSNSFYLYRILIIRFQYWEIALPQWSWSRTHGRCYLIVRASPIVPLKTRRVEVLMHIKFVVVQSPKDKVEKLGYQLNEEAERTERPIRRLSKVMYGSTCADMQVDVIWECLSSIKHAVGARRNRRQKAGEIARHTTQATGRLISRFTVARRLHGGGLFARRPVRCVPLMPAHRRRHSLWCREHWNWRVNEWGRVLFTDESRFSLSSDSHRILIWREWGSRNHPSNIIERDRFGGRGVLVWGGIMLVSRADLHIFDAGSVNGTRYCNEILLPYVHLFRGAMGSQFLFMDDNAPCHRTVAAEQLLESEDIERMD
ncbi:transposable element Tcb2 transposase [Trichonephila clavipes]|nr:transposable element Tcb2 transposase [Trichonephila clavipes]